MLFAGQTSGFFCGSKSVFGHEAVLEIVDAEIDGLLKRDRAQMAGDLHSALVRLVDRGFEIGTLDVGVCLDPRRALLRPVRNEAPRRLRRSRSPPCRSNRSILSR